MGHSTRLSAAPLQAQLRLRKLERNLTWERLAFELRVTSRTLARLMAATEVSQVVAGRMASKLELHESLLWPREWEQMEPVTLTPCSGETNECARASAV